MFGRIATELIEACGELARHPKRLSDRLKKRRVEVEVLEQCDKLQRRMERRWTSCPNRARTRDPGQYLCGDQLSLAEASWPRARNRPEGHGPASAHRCRPDACAGPAGASNEAVAANTLAACASAESAARRSRKDCANGADASE